MIIFTVAYVAIRVPQFTKTSCIQEEKLQRTSIESDVQLSEISLWMSYLA